MLRRLVIFVFLFFLPLIFSFPKQIHAQGEFTSAYEVLYEITESGETQVVQKVKLINQKTNFYATEFEISLGQIDAKEIKAYDAKGLLKTKVEKKDGNTFVRVYFTDKVVGLNKSVNLTLYYTSTNILIKNGQVKEINLPKLDLDRSIVDYNLQVKVPQTFGKPSYIKPVYRSSLYFTKEDLTKGQIAIAFGKSQVLNFKLTYHIKNNKIAPGIYEIALPADNAYQQVYLFNVSPKPLTVDVDPEGNWLAKYFLAPKEEKIVVAKGSVELFLEPNSNWENSNFSDFTKIYQQEQEYWEVSDPKIQELAHKLKTPEAIYDYVVEQLSYNYDRISEFRRLGAKYVLAETRSAICTEFTDLFIALARAAGIPAREVRGYALTDNSKLKPLSLEKDVLHAWPEYYDAEKKIWRQVDPTWENTSGGIDYFHTFDLSHFAFVKRGVNSDYPIPAGAYKINSLQTKDVEITFGKKENLWSKEDLKISVNLPETIYSGLSHDGEVILENDGSTAKRESEVIISLGNGILISKQQDNKNLIPPLATKKIKFTFKSNSFYSNQNLQINVTYQDKTIQKTVKTRTLNTIFFLPILVVIFLLAMLILILYLKKWKK